MLGPAAKEFNQCSVDGCARPIHARSLCHTHYMKAHRRGVLAVETGVPAVRIRFYAPDTTDRALKRLSRITGEPVSHILRDIIEAVLKEKGVL